MLIKVSDFIWGIPLIVLLLGTGLYLTVLLRGIQFTKLRRSLYLGLIKRKESTTVEGDIDHYQALMTALAATVGTGNIAGVATAIAAGGPGALFWMWITGLFGMATKYSEAVLGVMYREVNRKGEMCGGPMYYIKNGLGQKWLGALFAIFASVAAFGLGNMVQSNSVAIAFKTTFGVSPFLSGILLSVFTALVILGGIKSIGRVAGVLVPFMIILYIGTTLSVICLNYTSIIPAFKLILKGAFSGSAITGGFLGATIREAVRFGIARGLFSNGSGLGSAPIAAAAAKTKYPQTQALVSMTQTFFDTIIVCALTGLAIICSGVWSSGETGVELTSTAFDAVLPFNYGSLLVAVSLIIFAYSTMLGWSYYGEKSIEYLLGERAVKPYRLLFCIFIFVGAVSELRPVWLVSDIMNGFMAFPNLLALLLLSKKIAVSTREYFKIADY
ncbi:alanine/glycine:cation symporter family protein [candidate division KSB1 bacterium]